MKKTKKSLLWNDVLSIFRRWKWHFWSIWFLLWFLLFLVNLFAWIAHFSSQTASSLEDKLGMFFYIKEYDSFESEIYSAVISLQEELESAGLSTTFVSKEDAINSLLGERNPVLIEKLQALGIWNPLPATLYVTFSDETELLLLKRTLVPYRNIITNAGQLNSLNSLGEQEERNVRAINTWRFVQYFSYALMLWVAFVVLLLLLYFVRVTLALFDKEILVKKELWASYRQIILPFIVSSVFLLIWSRVIMVILSVVVGFLLSSLSAGMLGLDWVPLFGGYLFALWSIWVGELIVLMILAIFISRWYVSRKLY